MADRKLRLTVRAPGTLLSRVMDMEITSEQAALVALLLQDDGEYTVIPKAMLREQRKPIGFQPPEKGGTDDSA